MNIRHSTACRCFLADVEDRLAFLQYEESERQMVITHTFVPDKGRGRGIAEALLRAAIGEAERAQRAVVFQCPFAAAIARRRGWANEASAAADSAIAVMAPAAVLR